MQACYLRVFPGFAFVMHQRQLLSVLISAYHNLMYVMYDVPENTQLYQRGLMQFCVA